MYRRRIFGTVGLGFALFLAGCSIPGKPEAPTYEIDVDIPVADELITMQEVVSNRQDFLTIRPGGTVGIDIEQDIDRFEVGDNLRLTPPGANYDVPVAASGGSFDADLAVDLPDGIRPAQALVRSGSLQFDLSNTSGRDLDVSIALPDFTVQGNSANGNRSVPAGGQATLWVALDGASFIPAVAQQLRFRVALQAGAAGNGGNLHVSLQSAPVLLEQVQGEFQDLSVAFETSRKDIAFPEGQYAVTLTAAEVEVQIANGIGAACELDMTVVGRREGASVSLSIPADQRLIAAGDPNSPVTSTVLFDQDNSNILDFLNLIPASIEIQGGLRINDGNAQVARTDGMDLKVLFRSPLDLVLGETTILTEPRDIGIDDAKTRERLTTHVGVSHITLDLINHLPVGVKVRLMVGTDPNHLGAEAALVIPKQGEILLPAAPVDPATGVVRDSVSSETSVDLTADDVAVFSLYPLYSQVEMQIGGTGGARIQVVEEDFARVSMRAKIRIRVDKNLFD